MTGIRRVTMRPGSAALVLLGLVAGCSSAPPTRVDVIRPTPPPGPPASGPPGPGPAPAIEGPAAANVVWALRGGLNVAALLCKDQIITAGYNRMLKVHRSLLDDVYAAEQARYRQQFGSAGIARHDVAMTRLYNGFASVPDRRRFCTAATRILDEVLAAGSADVPRMATRALTTLEPGAMRLVNSAG